MLTQSTMFTRAGLIFKGNRPTASVRFHEFKKTQGSNSIHFLKWCLFVHKVPLYVELHAPANASNACWRAVGLSREVAPPEPCLHGYHAHKKQRPPRTLP